MKKFSLWLNGTLLGLLPIFELSLDLLPHLYDLIPANIYKTVGALAVTANILLALLAHYKPSKPQRKKSWTGKNS